MAAMCVEIQGHDVSDRGDLAAKRAVDEETNETQRNEQQERFMSKVLCARWLRQSTHKNDGSDCTSAIWLMQCVHE